MTNCQYPGCNRVLWKDNKSGKCRWHVRAREPERLRPGHAWAVVDPEVLKAWMDTSGVNEAKKPTLNSEKMRLLSKEQNDMVRLALILRELNLSEGIFQLDTPLQLQNGTHLTGENFDSTPAKKCMRKIPNNLLAHELESAKK